MKIIKMSELMNGPCFQGDIMISAEPAVDKKAKEAKDNIVAHSETGHNHIAENAKVFELDDMTMFLKPNGKGFIDGVPYIDIVHQRSFDTHETLRLLFDIDAVPKISRQEEYTPAGWRIVAD